MDCNFIFSEKFYTIVFVLLSLPIDVSYASHASPYRGTSSHNSHPMLASVFNLANNVRQLQTRQDMRTLSTINGDSRNIMRTGQIVDAHNGIQLSFNQAQLNRQHDIINLANKAAHVIDTSSDILTDAASHAFSQGKAITGSSRPIITAKTGSSGASDFVNRRNGHMSGFGNVGSLTIDDSAGIRFAADMLCSLCQRQGEAECIAIHCANDQSIGLAYGSTINNPSLHQLEPTLLPILNDNFNFANQLDRHDLLQATTVAVNQGSNQGHSLDTNSRHDRMNGKQFSDVPDISQRGNTAPIWSMSHGLLGTSVLPDIRDGNRAAPVRSMSDLVNVGPDVLSEKTVPLGNMNVNGDVNGITLIDFRNLGNTQGSLFANGHGDVQPIPSLANIGSQHSKDFAQPPLQQPAEGIPLASSFAEQPLEIPTNILRQMVNIDFQTISQTPDNVLSRGFGTTQNENIGQIVRNEATSEQHMANNIKREPHIPVANDVFADAKHENNGHGFIIPGRFMAGNNDINPSTVKSVTNPPTIPTARNIFADVNTVPNSARTHTFVLNNRVNTDTIGIHEGNGPIVQNVPITGVQQGMHIMQNVPTTGVQQGMHIMQNVPTTGVQQGMHIMQNVPITGVQQGMHIMQNVPITGVQQGMHIMNEEVSASVIGEGVASTTTSPTMNPRRRAVLQNWSHHLLNTINV